MHTQGTPDDPCSPADYADAAAEAVRGLNHATFGGTGYEAPSDVYRVLGHLATMLARLPRLVAVLARCWRGTVPGGLLAAGYLSHGEAGLALLAGLLAITAGVWWWRWPASFLRCVVERGYGAVRWHTVYRRRWPTALD